VTPELRQQSPDASFRGAGDDAPLPAHQPTTYYDRPLLKAPHWEWNVVTYLFLGGIMGNSASLILVAPETDIEGMALARNARYSALVLSLACPIILISHLGRPERFLNMLRIVKLKSPMSLGAWGLVAFSNLAALSALGQAARDGLVPEKLTLLAPRKVLDPLLALFGSFMASYTGVLISATAIPVWAKGKRHIPALSVCSGLAAACALQAALLALRGGSHRTRRKLERLELFAALAELALLADFRRHAGTLGAPMFTGARGRKLLNVTVLGGIALR
jgi:formate-dependent nitrite reductase membrane component NrfD